MIYQLSGKVMQVGGVMARRLFSSLAFNVRGAQFPETYYGTNTISDRWLISSATPNIVTINYGDGTVASYNFVLRNGLYRVGWTTVNTETTSVNETIRVPTHYYTDGNSGNRIITLSFSNPSGITEFGISFCKVYKAFPIEVDVLNNLDNLTLSYTTGINSFPYSIANNKKLRTLILSNAGPVLDQKIPEEFFTLPLRVLNMTDSVNLSNIETSNFSKINLLKNTLKTLQLTECGIITLPNSITEVAINDLRIDRNKFLEVPPQVNLMPPTLSLLYVSSPYFASWGNLSNQVNLLSLLIGNSQAGSTEFPTTIPPWLSALIKLKSLSNPGVSNLEAKVDDYINNMYSFIITNASMTGSSALPFRGMTLSPGVVAKPSGIYQQPAGFALGTSNGNPASPQEKVWVMVNQYLHTWNLKA